MDRPLLSLRALCSLGRALTHWSAAKGRGLDPQLRERIILHVSAVNSCDVCTAFHVRAAERIGLDDGDIAAACKLDLSPRDARTRAALHYAELRTLGLEDESEHQVAVTAFEREFSADEQAAVRATVDLFTFNNRFNNTWERLPGAGMIKRRLGVDRLRAA